MKTEYKNFHFGKNINGTNKSGIVNIKTMKLVWLCNKEEANIILTGIQWEDTKGYLNAFGNYLIKNSIKLKDSNHVAEQVTNFLNESK
ncbi:MAG: hypothetical protein NVS9B7_29270 [Flavisolibacter sp.]